MKLKEDKDKRKKNQWRRKKVNRSQLIETIFRYFSKKVNNKNFCTYTFFTLYIDRTDAEKEMWQKN